jgi:type II secretory pathway pseudopilin PulG
VPERQQEQHQQQQQQQQQLEQLEQAQQQQQQQQQQQPSGAAGRLLVRETKIAGGQQAVHCRGSGAIRHVRVIYQRALPLYWFDVDSADPGSRAAVAVAGAGAGPGGAPCGAAQPWPSSAWAAAAAAAAGGCSGCAAAEAGGACSCCGLGPEYLGLGVAAGGLGKRLQPRSIKQALARLDPALLQQLLRPPPAAEGHLAGLQ